MKQSVPSVRIRRQAYWMVFVIPALVIYLLFFIIPSLTAVWYSFTDWNGIHADFIGLSNYIKMFSDYRMEIVLKNTVYYGVGIMLAQNVAGLFLALMLDRNLKTRNALRMLFFMPIVFSPLVVTYIWNFILEPNIGVFKHWSDITGLGFLAQNWLGEPKLAIFMIIFVKVWQGMGYNMVIYLAGLQTIPSEYYESAMIDGARAWQRFKSITFPLIAPTFTINVILSSINSLKMFDTIYGLTGGGPGFSTHSIASMIYQVGFGKGSNWGYGAAMSVVMFLIIFLISWVQTTVLKAREVDT